MANVPNTAALRRAFVDVKRGYSVALIEGQPVYVRHSGHVDHVDCDTLQEQFEAAAKAAGLPSEAQRLETLYAKGEWSPEKEAEIARQKDGLARMEDTRKTIAVPSVLRSHDETIAQERKKLLDMQVARAQALGLTVEVDASDRLEDHYLVCNLFSDKGLTCPWITAAEFDNLTDAQVQVIQAAYRAAIEPCSEANLRRLAVNDLFLSYYLLCADDLSAFWGRPVCDLTYFQVRLSNYARYYKSLTDNTDLSKLPPAKRADPDALEQAFITQRNIAAGQAEGKLPSNLTSKDMAEMGIKGQYTPAPPDGLSGVELVKWLRKNTRPANG